MRKFTFTLLHLIALLISSGICLQKNLSLYPRSPWQEVQQRQPLNQNGTFLAKSQDPGYQNKYKLHGWIKIDMASYHMQGDIRTEDGTSFGIWGLVTQNYPRLQGFLMWNDLSKRYSAVAKILPPSTLTHLNFEASIYDNDFKIVGVMNISHDTSTNKVEGYVNMDAINPLPIFRMDINRDSLIGYNYWQVGSQKLYDGEVEVKSVGDNFVGHRNDPFWSCQDFFIYPNKNGLGVQQFQYHKTLLCNQSQGISTSYELQRAVKLQDDGTTLTYGLEKK